MTISYKVTKLSIHVMKASKKGMDTIYRCFTI